MCVCGWVAPLKYMHPRLTPPLTRSTPAGQSAPAPNRFKGEDFTSMFVLAFGADGAVQNITWQDTIQITV